MNAMMKNLIILGVFLLFRTAESIQDTGNGKPSVRWDLDVTLQQFREGFQSDNDLIFVFETNETSPGCPMVPNNEIGIRLEMSQLITEWKAIARHAVIDADIYGFIQELEGTVPVTTTALLDQQTMLNYDIVLWKHDALIGDGDRTRESVYRVVDARTEMRPGSLYTFYWNRDDLLTELNSSQF